MLLSYVAPTTDWTRLKWRIPVAIVLDEVPSDGKLYMGADARTDGHHAVVRGIPQLSSAPVWSSDIRAGAGLVLAGLVADGETEVHDVFHIDRGYPLFVENLVSLGAEIERVV